MPAAQARVLLRNGAIAASATARATAMLVADGHVAWLGDDAGSAAHTEGATIVDLGGRLVTPGFVDAHVHLASTGFALVSADLSGVATLHEALELLAQAARGAGRTLTTAHGWDETRWPERRWPTRDEIDAVVGPAPAYVSRVDSHSAIVSTGLVELAPEIAASAGWSADGRVEREAHHAARAAVDGLRTASDRRDAIARALAHAGSAGVASVHELNAPHIAPYDDFDLIDQLTAAGRAPLVERYWGAPIGGRVDTRLAGHAGDFCVDGAIGSRTAAMAAPYSDAQTAGHLYLDAQQVRDHVVSCTRAGLQAGFHVIGDRALAEVASGLRAAADEVGVDAMVAARHRLEHVEMPTDDDIKVLADLGVVASVQPAFDAAWGAADELYEQRLGTQRAAAMNPFGRMLRSGVALAFGSDSPITPLDPWAAVRAAVLHHADDERLTVAEALDAHTRGGHHASRHDHGGVLDVGRPASYAIWETPSGLDSDGLPGLGAGDPLPTCVQTVVCGDTIYSRGPNVPHDLGGERL
jgi:predicted amidohydrolase YtcJ